MMELLVVVLGVCCLGGLAVAFASGPGRALPAGRMDVVHSMEIETPHLPWANPLSGGPIRAWLMPPVVAGRDLVELAQRLEMRYDTLTLDVSGHNSWGFGDFYGRRGRTDFTIDYGYLTEDMTASQTYDVLVLPGTHPWHQLPEAARQALLGRVRRGEGLVLISPTCDPQQLGDLADLSPLVPDAPATDVVAGEPWQGAEPHWITAGVPLGLLPFEQMSRRRYRAHGEVLLAAAGGPILAVGAYGKGRVAAFGYANFGFSPRVANPWAVEKAYPYWEVYYSLLCRAIVWAAGREPALKLGKVTVEPSECGTGCWSTGAHERHGLQATRATQPAGAGTPAMVRVPVAAGDRPATVEVQFPDYSGQGAAPVVMSNRWQAGSVEVPVPPELSGGLQFAHVQLKDEAGVLDWASVPFHVTQPVTVAGLELDQDVVRVGEAVSGRVRVEAGARAEASLDLRFEDNYGRVLDRRRQPLRTSGVTPVAFSLSTAHGLTRLGRVVAEVRQGERLVDRAARSLFVRIPQAWEDYEIIMDRFLPEPAPGRWPAIARRLEEMNVSVMGAISAEMSEHVNFMIQADVVCPGFHPRYHQPQWRDNKAAYVQTGDRKHLVRNPCYTDPAYRRQFREGLGGKVERFARFSPISYYAYEEASLGYFHDGMDICWSPTCLAGFREWLKKTYGSLEALNAEWETDYASWDEVMPLTAPEAQARGNYAPWADHRTFMEVMWADVYREGRDIIRAIDPNATICLSGNQDCTPHNGYDYARLNHYIDQMQQYTGWNVEDFDRAFYPGMKLTGCTGYGVSGADLTLQLWGRLFHGETAGCVIFWEISCLNPDLTFCRSGRDLAAHFAALRGGGIARLLSFARPDTCGIAVHYSYPSFHGTWITDGRITTEAGNQSRAFDLFDRGRVAWTMLLESLGYQYEFVSYGQVEAGDLIRRGFRLLVLPESVAISEAEAKAIEAFVREGGVVVADLWPAVMDEHCRWRSAGRLDGVFGLAHEGIGPADFARTEAGERVQVRSAETGWLTGHPGAARHGYGKGQAFYLGCSLAPTAARKRQKPEADAGPFREALAQVLREAELKPPVRLTEDGRSAVTCEAFRFEAQGAEYFGVVRYRGGAEGDPDVHGSVPPVADSRPGSGGKAIHVAFPRRGHLYDVRQRRYLGEAESVETPLEVGEARLYALLPYTVERVAVTAPGTVSAGDELAYSIQLTAAGGAVPGNHVAVVTAIAPDGCEARAYGTRVPLERGAGSGAIPLSLSDAVGTWRIRAMDVVSGVSGEARVDIVREE